MGRKKCEWEKEVGGECGLVGWGGSVRWVEVGRRGMSEKLRESVSGMGRECEVGGGRKEGDVGERYKWEGEGVWK